MINKSANSNPAKPRLNISIRFSTVLISCFLFILAFFTMLYHQFQTVLLDSLNRLNTEFVTQVSATSAFGEEFLQNMANQIFYTHSVTKLRSYDNPTNSQVIEGIRELNSFTASSTIIDSIYIFNGKQQYIYSTSSSGAVSDAAESFADEAAAELFQNRSADKRLVPIRRYSMSANSSSNRDLYSFLFFELDRDGVPRDNAIMFNISRGWFTKLYFNNDVDSDAFIIDGGGELIAMRNGLASAEYEKLSARVLSSVQEGGASSYFIYASETGEKNICFFSAMSSHNWYYVKSVPYDQCLNGLKLIERKTLVFLGLGFGTLIIAGAIISLHIYLPFQRITRRLSSLEPEASQDTEQLMESLNRLIERSSSAEKINDSLKEMLRSEALQGLLTGSHRFDTAQSLVEEYGLRLSPGAPLLLCLASGLRLTQYLERARADIPFSEGTIVQNEYTILFLQPTGNSSLSPVLQSFCSRFPATWFIISPEVTDWRWLPETYGKLVETFRLRFLFQRERLLFSETFHNLDNSPSVLEGKIPPILASLKKGSYAKTLAAYGDFTASFSGKSHRSILFSLTALSNAVLKLYFELFPAAGSYEKRGREFQRLLQTLSDMETLNHYFEPLFLRITEQIQRNRHSRQVDVLAEVTAKIRSRFCDVNLSSQSLADDFNLSPAYLCRIFRQANGCSLVDFINQLRIARAQEILRDPAVKIKEVPLQVGIENKQYFFSLFKQTTGLTPKQFQNRQGRG